MISFNSYVTNEQINITATNGRLPAGCADSSWLTGNIYYFNRLYVQEEYRGQKIGEQLLKKLLEVFDNSNNVLLMHINPYGELSYEQLEAFYKYYGFRKCFILDEEYKKMLFYIYKKEDTIVVSNINNMISNVQTNRVLYIFDEKVFYIGPNHDIKIIVYLYERHDKYYLSLWVDGYKELNTIEYEYAIEDKDALFEQMESFVLDNKAYIMDIVNQDGDY